MMIFQILRYCWCHCPNFQHILIWACHHWLISKTFFLYRWTSFKKSRWVQIQDYSWLSKTQTSSYYLESFMKWRSGSSKKSFRKCFLENSLFGNVFRKWCPKNGWKFMFWQCRCSWTKFRTFITIWIIYIPVLLRIFCVRPYRQAV